MFVYLQEKFVLDNLIQMYSFQNYSQPLEEEKNDLNYQEKKTF